MRVGKSKASDYFIAGIILIVLAAVIWSLEYFVLDRTINNIILLLIPSVFGLLSLAHFAVAANKWYSSH